MAVPSTRGPSVLFQPPNSIGLGHINRLAAIALALRAEQPGLAVAFAIDGFDHGLLKALEIPWVSVPWVDLLAHPNWRAWPGADRARLIQTVADGIIDSLNPSVIVFDCIPHEAVFRAAQRRRIPFCLVAHKAKSIGWYAANLRSAMNQAAAIIVPHAQEDFTLPRQWESKTHYVGTIVRTRRATVDAAEILRLPKPRIVVTAGGGGYPQTAPFFNLAVAACRECRQAVPSLSTIVVTGPLFQDWDQLRLRDALLLPSYWDMAGLYEEADAIVCQGGYNTIAEVAQSGSPAVCVPAERTLDDQLDRARQTAARHPGFCVLENPNPADLAAHILAGLRAGNQARESAAEADAAVAAARVVAGLIGRVQPKS